MIILQFDCGGPQKKKKDLTIHLFFSRPPCHRQKVDKLCINPMNKQTKLYHPNVKVPSNIRG